MNCKKNISVEFDFTIQLLTETFIDKCQLLLSSIMYKSSCWLKCIFIYGRSLHDCHAKVNITVLFHFFNIKFRIVYIHGSIAITVFYLQGSQPVKYLLQLPTRAL